MYPILFESSDYFVPTWHVFFVAAVIFGLLYFSWLNKRYPPSLSNKQVHIFFIIGYVTGLLGARTYSILFDESYHNFSLSLVFTMGALSFYGSFLVGGAFSYAYLRFKRVNLPDVGDKLILAILLGLFGGRLGCFFNGDDYGMIVHTKDTIPWWAVTFPNHPVPLPRHPTQLYESFSYGIIFLCLHSNFRTLRQKFKLGTIGPLGLSLLSTTRFLVEFIRGDERGWLWNGVFSIAQLISLCLIILSSFYLVKLNRVILRNLRS